MKITKHCVERIAERTSTKQDPEKVAKKVWQTGKKIQDYSDKRFRDWANSELKKGGYDREIRFSGTNAYIFSKNGVLITVLVIPMAVRGYIAAQKPRVKTVTMEYTDEEMRYCDLI